ncbi:MAG: hypothetical protein BJ554DRAFT_1326 [Olpidium bornovanus]|uniref:Uncharacterized protein n=1 Tax=Olpidium bornovanus TaxID=278681 RepID=A0A8H7ZSN0_9FUNG|nr:MAG: hypothetical protein BJ554DRAFT_1326 [Olpidium bornovanus]
MSSAAKLLERRERVVRDAALQLSERAAILAKVDAALNSAKRESPQRPNHVLAPRLSSVTATAFPPCSSSSTSRAGPPLPAVPGSVAEGATGQQPPIAFHRHQLSFVVPSPGTGAGAAVPSRPATAPAVGAFPVSKSLAAASLITNSVPAFTGSGGPAGPIAGFFPGRCVICLQAGHVL